MLELENRSYKSVESFFPVARKLSDFEEVVSGVHLGRAMTINPASLKSKSI